MSKEYHSSELQNLAEQYRKNKSRIKCPRRKCKGDVSVDKGRVPIHHFSDSLPTKSFNCQKCGYEGLIIS